MKRIKIAQIGTGHDHACVVMQTLRLLEKEGLYEIIGYASVPEDDCNLPEVSFKGNSASYEGVPRLTVEEILNYPGLDAVCIESEDRALTKYALAAAERGLHIHMDKPGGTEHEEFNRLIDTVKQRGAVFHTGYMYRYNPAVLKLKRDIADGKLGEIISVEAQMNCIHGIRKRNWLGNFPGGMLFFLGCHMVDLVYSIMGEPEELLPLSCSSGMDGTTAEDFGIAVFKYKNGVSLAKSTAIERGGFERRQLVVVGTEGTVELKPFEWLASPEECSKEVVSPQKTGIREAYSDNWHETGKFEYSPVHGRYDAMMRAFASYVTGEKQNPFDCEYERRLHGILLRACGRAE